MPKPKPTPDELRAAKAEALEIAETAVRDDAENARWSGLVREQLVGLAEDLAQRRAKLLALPKAGVSSDRGYVFADWFKCLLPPETAERLAPTWRESWAKCFDQLEAIDKRTPEDIARVCRWARTDSFWARNFLSPLKLRQRDDNGVLYFDRFLQRMKPIGRPSGPAAGQYAEPSEPLPVG